jgi:hypothetical protein
MTEWINQDILCERLGIERARLVLLIKEGILPRAKWNGTATLWDWDEVRGSKFATDADYAAAPISFHGPSRVYFIELNEFVKIGFTQSVKMRVMQIQYASPYKVKLLHATPGGKAEEEFIHAMFEADRVRGEWFRMSPELCEFIEQRKAEDAEKTKEAQVKAPRRKPPFRPPVTL